MSSRLVPKTYVGKDENGNELCRYQAADANKDINPKEVASKANKVATTTDSLIKEYNKKLLDLKDFSYTAIIVKDYDFEDTINQIIQSTKDLKKQIDTYMEQIIEAASNAHDELQENYNESAKKKAYECSGVVHVKEI